MTDAEQAVIEAARRIAPVMALVATEHLDEPDYEFYATHAAELDAALDGLDGK